MAKTAEILEIPATITERGQTTVPAAIRRMLALGKRDQVVFRGLADGTVVIAKKQSSANDGDPVIGRFLAFLAHDMANEPARIRPVPKSLVARGKDLAKGVKVDLDAALPEDDA
ncbi:regulator (plasmid) [Bradyrhizobium sp. SK17]|jgi:antitoxin PrlF|uniref:type II toxin-antitoxin system PrlF family antitoxin n=1 Tax=Bradyrhizobium sp. SK17 TaxID=2057741 RepID=UPI000C319A70|nr:type II toxin-antitoxin system PrlF family antitoxin [Bradyrhizobium sp. SK17]AUD00081.1 regulator [Bradyrhizobium sp. SK17]AUD00304.1 regulator [Bradyrhizobium sp. SK17]MBN8936576.1 type II toxin-antitoxin system PrlF family antitoxin [Hyphomicrobiales bacterium]